MSQKLFCPKCGKLLIVNEDLVTSKRVEFDLEKIKTTDRPVGLIKCHNCKRRIKYFVEK